MANRTSISERLASTAPGDWQSLDTLVPLVYAELRALAGSYLREERPHTLQPTALVHEAFLKMMGNEAGWHGKDHFKAVAAKAMRQVLVDYARSRNRLKRGGGERILSIDVDGMDEMVSSSELGKSGGIARGAGFGATEFQIEELDVVLTALSKTSQRLARVAEMRLFGGMDTSQIARVSGDSEKSVQRDWKLARAWISAKIQEQRSE